MPSFAVHVQLAREVFARGPEAGAPPADDAAARQAFLHGALGPDMGYYPGGWRFLSNLAHYVRSAELARNLLRHAEGPVERAFAHGWLSHLLADVAIHPAINAAAGALVHGAAERPLTFADDPAAHLRVEVGLDAVLFHRRGGAGDVGLQPFTGTSGLDFVAAAYEDTYDVPVDRRRLLAGHRAVARFQPLQARLDTVAGCRHLGRRPPGRSLPFLLFLYLPARAITALVARGSALHALLHTAPPPAWLVRDVEVVYATFPERFGAAVHGGLADLPDYNLDTGAVDPEPAAYRLTAETLARLQRHRSR